MKTNYKWYFGLEIKIKDAFKSGYTQYRSSKREIVNNNALMKELGYGNAAKGKIRFKQLLKRKLYWINELQDIEYYALYLYGYIKSNSRSKNKRMRILNEKGQFESVTCLLPENESMQHMRDKEFVASLNYEHAVLEYPVPGRQNRIDVMFIYHGKTLGVEIQKSALEYSRLKDKVRMLKEQCHYWYLIMPKKFAEKYRYLTGDNGEVVTMHQAITKIKKFLALKHPVFGVDE